MNKSVFHRSHSLSATTESTLLILFHLNRFLAGVALTHYARETVVRPSGWSSSGWEDMSWAFRTELTKPRRECLDGRNKRWKSRGMYNLCHLKVRHILMMWMVKSVWPEGDEISRGWTKLRWNKMTFGRLWRRTGRVCGSVFQCFDYSLNLCTFYFMFTLHGCSNLACVNAHYQKVAINYPLAGGKKKKKMKKKNTAKFAFGPRAWLTRHTVEIMRHKT